MALDTRRTYLCYNNSDLIRDGFIPLKIKKEYIPVDSFNLNRLKNPQKGISYKVVRDESGEVIQVIETKKLLPAEKIKIEIDFSKVMKSAIQPVLDLADANILGGTVGTVGVLSIAPLGLGGITQGISEITYHLLDAETVINKSVKVTQEMINSGIYIVNEGYPLSVFGIVKEYEKVVVINEKTITEKIGLDFTEEQLRIIGKFSSGAWQGSVQKRIDGATGSSGLFGEKGDADIKFEDVAQLEQEQLFVKIVRDDRKLKFRGDNPDASGDKAYPFKITGKWSVDATDQQIRIKTVDENNNPILKAGDIIYLTYSVASNRLIRQTLTHLGKIGQGNSYGITGFVGAIESKADIFDFQISSWLVPILPSGIVMSNIDSLEYEEDSDYKLSAIEYVNIRRREISQSDYKREEDSDEIEGWRVSQAITDQVKKFWAADYRGILLYDDNLPEKVEIVYSVSEIRDQEWFTEYLENLDFTSPTGPDGQYIESDLEKKIEENIELDRESGQMFDISEVNNSMLFDREKVPYYRPFAQALLKVSKYNEEDESTGVGIINLDLIGIESLGVVEIIPLYYQDLSLFDLSFTEFKVANAQPLQRYSCSELFDIMPHHYFSQNYDAVNNGPGAWYSVGTIENQVLEWRPAGGEIESYWKQETPYFCGNFTKKSRVYIERMGGPSLDNYSWIYVDTQPSVPSNISVDSNQYMEDAMVLFKDDVIHNGLAYNVLKDISFFNGIYSYEKDINQNHIREDYEYSKYKIRGYNRILGDQYSYSNGFPVIDNLLIEDSEGIDQDLLYEVEIFNESGATENGESNLVVYNEEEGIYVATLPQEWYINKMIIEYDWGSNSSGEDIKRIKQDNNRYITFYFKDTDISIDNINFPMLPLKSGNPLRGKKNIFNIDFGYYNGETLNFYGGIWGDIKLKSIKLEVASITNPNEGKKVDIEDYRINSGQSAIVNDKLGKILIFYSNEETNNIDVAISYDNGGKWNIHKGLIRLVKNESATIPFAIKSYDGQSIYLFYVLNDIFLMCKKINTSNFNLPDAFIDPLVPDSYGIYDFSIEDYESFYWGKFSKLGHNIRRSSSYFVAGNSEEDFFQENKEINKEIEEKNKENIKNKIDEQQVPRFIFVGDEDEMDSDFEGVPAAYVDNSGTYRVFMIVDNKLSVKRSADFFEWKYDIKDVEIHRDYVDPNINKGKVIEVKNIQILRNDYDLDIITVLYFHDNMLFMRHFSSSSLNPIYDIDGDIVNSQIKNDLELTSSSSNKPIFLVGNMPEDIRNKKIEEIDNNVLEKDSELMIKISYNKEEVEKFNEEFNVDTNTQAYGYTSTNGLIKVLYKDNFDLLNSIIVDSMNSPTPEVWYIDKKAAVNG